MDVQILMSLCNCGGSVAIGKILITRHQNRLTEAQYLAIFPSSIAEDVLNFDWLSLFWFCHQELIAASTDLGVDLEHVEVLQKNFQEFNKVWCVFLDVLSESLGLWLHSHSIPETHFLPFSYLSG